ncbi:AI-2E family transporter [Phycicoccus jejuensis]|uniref:AI-2E family transporter n=1 Tax=Phycicoccus jejuensis TaxID=367299 RepID=UPI00384A5F24
MRLPRPGRPTTSGGPSDLPRSLPVTGVEPLTAHDPRGRAEWGVPLGVRTASEWAWRGIVIGAALGVVLWLTTVLSEVVIPIVVSLLLSALLHPVHNVLARALPRGLAAFVTVIGTMGVVFGLISFVGSQLTSQLGDITTKVTDGIEQVRSWVQTTFGITDTQLTDYIARARESMSSAGIGDTAAAAGLTVGHLLTGFFLALFTLFFFLYDGAGIWGWVVRLSPRGARERVHSSGIIAWGQLAAFTRATIFVAAADAIGIGVGAAILGVPFASGIALLVFFGAFIPIVGAAVSGAVAVLLALVALGPVKALIMLAIVIGVQQMESHLLQPLLIGRAMSLHPLAVILAIAAGLILAGIIGGLIAVPTVAVLNAVGHHLLDNPESPAQDVDHDEDMTARAVLGDEAADRAERNAAESEARRLGRDAPPESQPDED